LDLIWRSPDQLQTDFAGTNYFFYDFNTKFNYRFHNVIVFTSVVILARDVLNWLSPGAILNLNFPYGNAHGYTPMEPCVE
jgi:hypothetical protein